MFGKRPPKPFRLDVGAKRVEREVDAELDYHLAMRTRKLIGAGLDPAAADERARQLFGNQAAIRDACLTIDRDRERAMTRASRLSALRQDVVHALRLLRANKGFTAVLVLILALGIGANSAVFTLIDALMKRSLPVAHPEELITIGDPSQTSAFSSGSPRSDLFSYPLYTDLRDGNRVVSGLYASGHTGRLDAVISDGSAGGPGPSGAEHPRGRFVSGNYFEVLQVAAQVGRTFTAAEDVAPGRDPVAVISEDYWRRRFAGDRSVVGRVITVNGAPLTIVGVTKPGWNGDIVGQQIDIWMPIMTFPLIMAHRPWLGDRGASWLILMGRLGPGVTLAQARSALTTLIEASLTRNPIDGNTADIVRELQEHPVRVEPGGRGFSYYRSAYAESLLTLMAAVGLVLLVVCANVAHLMLARAAARGREISVRMALGAGRMRLVHQLLIETVLLAAGGGALGLLLAIGGSTALLRFATDGSRQMPLDVHPDARIVAFTAALSLLTAVLVGLVPALRATRVDLAGALRARAGGAAGAAGRPGRPALGRLLVVAQIALSLLLLVSTGMLLRSMGRLTSADIGIARDELLIARIDAVRQGYDGARLRALMRDLIARAEAVPGVAAATLSDDGLFSGRESGTTVQVEGFTASAVADTFVRFDDVGPGYFRALGAHLLQGRDFEPGDNEAGPKVAVINRTMARYFFKDASPIGHYVRRDSASYTIVGVVADVEGQDVRATPVRRLYLPTMQISESPASFMMEVRATGDPPRLVEPLRRALQAADPSLLVLGVDPLPDLIRESIGPARLVAKVVTAFGALTLVLAALGLYGVMAYATARRTSEFGLRMALGAAPSRVAGMVLREALLLVGGGVLIGLPLALAAAHLLEAQLFGIAPVDLPSIVVAIAVLGGSAIAAGYLPARRAARVAPLAALGAD